MGDKARFKLHKKGKAWIRIGLVFGSIMVIHNHSIFASETAVSLSAEQTKTSNVIPSVESSGDSPDNSQHMKDKVQSMERTQKLQSKNGINKNEVLKTSSNGITKTSAVVNKSQPVKQHQVKVVFNNLGKGAYFKSANANSIETFVNGKRYDTRQYLEANTTWKINRVGEDEENETWYDLGNNQWVQGTGIALHFDDMYSKKLPDIKPVDNKLQNVPVSLNSKVKINLKEKENYTIWDSYSDKRKYLNKYYVGPFTLQVDKIAISPENVTWLSVGQNEWIRLSGFDYEDIATGNGVQVNKTESTKDVDKEKITLTTLIKNTPEALYYTANNDRRISGLERNQWVLSNQEVKKGQSVSILEVSTDNSGQIWYRVGVNEWLSSDDVFNYALSTTNPNSYQSVKQFKAEKRS